VFCERTDNSIHKLGELMKRWGNRLTLKGLSIAEKYIKGRIEIIADLDIFRRGKIENLHAIFSADSTILKRNQAFAIEEKFKIWNISDPEAGYDSFMLVNNVEVVNCPKRFIPTLVRFQRANYLNDLWSGAVYMSLFDHRIKIIPLVAEREIDIVSIPAIELNQFASEDIEGGSKIVNHIPDNKGEIVGLFFLHAERKSVVAGLRVLLDDKFVRITFPKTVDLEIKVRDVFFGPFNL
jgi:hypothetical protein